MTLTIVLFLLRLLSAAVLIAFVGVAMWYMARDMRLTAASLQAQARPQGVLTVIGTEVVGLYVGQQFPLLPVTGIGRNPSNTIVLEDEYTSGEHVLISLRNSRWWVEDLNSRNGTLLNGQALTDTAVVSSGDIVTIGSTILKLEL